MRIPLVVWLSFWALFLPLVVSVIRWRWLDAPKKAISAWIGIQILMSLAALGWTKWVDPRNNMIVSYVSMPLQGVTILWGLAEWQVLPMARTTVRLCIPVLLAWWAFVFLFVENQANFSILGGPVLGLLALASALLALVTRALQDSEPIHASDWGWILAGIAIYFATNSTVTIVQAVAAARGDWELLNRTSIYKACIDIFATMAITGGFLWTTPPRSYGISSSPAP